MDEYQLIYSAIQLPLVILSFRYWEIMVLSVACATIYWIASLKRPKSKDYQILAFSKSLQRLCAEKGLNHALHESTSGSSAPQDVKDFAVRSALGDIDNVHKSQSPHVHELLEILSLGLQSGIDVSNNIRMFVSNLESWIDSRNRMLRNSLNMDMLSGIGVAFFVPLFGGIGASIIGASGSITGMNAAALEHSFEVILVVYIAVMSYVRSSFSAYAVPGNPIIGSIRAAAIGTAIIGVSSSIINYAI